MDTASVIQAPGPSALARAIITDLESMMIAFAGPVSRRLHSCPLTREDSVATEEAAHAVAAFILGRRFLEVSIIPDESTSGRVMFHRRRPEPQVEAFCIWRPSDEQIIGELTEGLRIKDSSPIERATENLLLENWPMVRHLARYLLECKVLTGRQTRRLLLRAQRKQLRRAQAVIEKDRRNYREIAALIGRV
jgi:hypothetical protein